MVRYSIVYLYASIAYFIPDLGAFLNFIGGINGVYLVFIIPILMYLKVFKDDISLAMKAWLYFIMGFGTIGGVVAVGSSLRVLLFR